MFFSVKRGLRCLTFASAGIVLASAIVSLGYLIGESFRELLAHTSFFLGLLSIISVLVAALNFLLAGGRMDSAKDAKEIVEEPPGWRLRDLAETVFSRKTYELVFEPTLENLSSEYQETLKEGRFWKAYFVCLRGYWSFWSAVFAQSLNSAFKVVSQIWKAIP